MNKQSWPERQTRFWYNKPGEIDHLFYGVFEGGGAKGIAYIGALKAMAKEKCWFRGVAGASAGAITAALIAAGMSPEEMEPKIDGATEQLQTGIWSGIRRLQKSTGYFPSDKLRDWLDDLLKEQVAQTTPGRQQNKEGINFQELYDTTGIELNIVAADLSLKSQIVFSHHETPNCSVADAVVASSAIPFAFPSRVLQIEDKDDNEKPPYHDTIVDGGVWSNFPMYIFEDPAFRAFYERDPERIDSQEILGFLLNESGAPQPPRDKDRKDVRFVQADSTTKFSAREWNNNKPEGVNESPSLTQKMVAWLLFPLYVLSRLGEWNSGIGPGRWPIPQSKSVHYLVESINGLLAGIHPLLLAIIPVILAIVGAREVSSYLLAEQIRVISATDWSDFSIYGARAFSVIFTALVVALSILFSFATVMLVIANHILLRASRRILYGLVSTYVAGPGAPVWAAKKGNVVLLPIPPTVNTLSFTLGAEARKELIESARQATFAKLAEIFPKER